MGRLCTAITTEVFPDHPTVSALPEAAPSAVEAVVSAAVSAPGFGGPVLAAPDTLPEIVPSGLVPVASAPTAVDPISSALLNHPEHGVDQVHYDLLFDPLPRPTWTHSGNGQIRQEIEILEQSAYLRYSWAPTRSSRLAEAWSYVHHRVSEHNEGIPTRLFFAPRRYDEIADYILARIVGLARPLAPPTKHQFRSELCIDPNLIGTRASRTHYARGAAHCRLVD